MCSTSRTTGVKAVLYYLVIAVQYPRDKGRVEGAFTQGPEQQLLQLSSQNEIHSCNGDDYSLTYDRMMMTVLEAGSAHTCRCALTQFECDHHAGLDQVARAAANYNET